MKTTCIAIMIALAVLCIAVSFVWTRISELESEARFIRQEHSMMGRRLVQVQKEQDVHTRQITLLKGQKSMEQKMSLAEAVHWLKAYQGYEPVEDFAEGRKPTRMKHAFDLTDEVVDTILAALPIECGGTKN